MNLGVIQQVGPPQELYDRPVNMFVAGFIGSPEMNFFEGIVTRTNGGLCIDAGPLNVPVPPELQEEVGAYAERRLDFGVRPENIHDADYTPPGIAGAPTSVVVDVTELMGNEVFLHLLAGETKLLARVDPRTKAQAGDHIEVVVDMDRVHFFDPQTEEALR
jgi:multiple sugar transport system ATP-binding protein